MFVDDAALKDLSTKRFGRLVQLEQTTSTNSVAMEMASHGEPEGLVVLAEHQSSGRGRLDRSWDSPPGASLLFSVLMRPSPAELPPSRRHLAVAALSLAMADAARAVAGVALQLKWPNDLIVEGAASQALKVAGVLAEVATGPAGAAIVAGMGVNVSWAPPGLAATSLEALADRSLSRLELLVAALGALDASYGDWGLVARRYRAECTTVGRQVVVHRLGLPDVAGLALHLDDDGRLVIDDGVARHTVAAGDVAHASVLSAPHGMTP